MSNKEIPGRMASDVIVVYYICQYFKTTKSDVAQVDVIAELF